MNSIDKVFAEVLNEIIPTKKELDLIEKITESLKTLIERKAKELNINYTKIEPQGSTGIKQTQLKNDFDIDLFIGLDYDQYSRNYEGLSKNKLKKVLKKDFLGLCKNWIIKSLIPKEYKNPRLLYAEHPYVMVNYITDYINLKIDIVLYFDLDLEYIKKNGPITAVDRSPWHGRFVRDNLNFNQKNDVRLLKQFFKACHSYGDKSAVGKTGFIGYSAELLIYQFADIGNVFKNFNNLKTNPIDYFNRSREELRKIEHFQRDCLIITDPTDMNRNVASAISEKAYRYCNQRIKDFMENPTSEYFIIKPIPEIELLDKEDDLLSKIFIIELKSNDEETHYTIHRDQLYSLGDSVKANGEKEFTHIKRFGKIIFEVYFEEITNEYNLAIYCENIEITPEYERQGPPIKNKLHADKFKKKNPAYYEKNGFLWVKTQRKFKYFLNFLKDFVKTKTPSNLEILNISNSYNCKTSSGKKAIYVLKNMVVPFT